MRGRRRAETSHRRRRSCARSRARPRPRPGRGRRRRRARSRAAPPRPRRRPSRSPRRAGCRARAWRAARCRRASSDARRSRRRARDRRRPPPRRPAASPGRADPEPARANGAVELPPAILPAGLDRRRRVTSANARASAASPRSSVYTASSVAVAAVDSPRSPPGASSSSRARAISASSAGTRTATRRSSLSAARSSGAGRTPRPRPARAYASGPSVRSKSSSSRRCSSSSASAPRRRAARRASRAASRAATASLALEDAHLAGLRARRHLELELAGERRDRRGRPERGVGHRQPQRRVQVVAVADEARVGPHAHDDERVAALAAAEAGVALAADADLLAVVDPGRDVDLELAPCDDGGRRRGSRRTAARAPRPPAAVRARPLLDELAEDVLRDAAGRTRRRRTSGTPRDAVPGSAPVAPQRSQGTATSTGTRDSDPGERLLELDLDDGLDVAAALRPRALPRCPEEVLAEERGEDVGEVAEVRERRLEAAAPEPRLPVAVVESRAARGRRAPRTPRRPRGSAARRRGRSRRPDGARARARGTPA